MMNENDSSLHLII